MTEDQKKKKKESVPGYVVPKRVIGLRAVQEVE
jgi:hypothetical protein